eukprot:TRINITY_DN55194_c0_g1_i1.p1 TRINITY_DN55194_c0_g1~~TRINITY_DN55194_c0_g1_i1.p1  ORF type:complete len:894 (+),score=224.54 TRINITY_DN55194_c0_g1_i1:67-2748(+)
MASVLVVGGGGREHAIVCKLAESPAVATVFCAPGNAGTAAEPKASNVPIKDSDIPGLVAFAAEKKVSLVFVGPEAPLCAGIADACRDAGVLCFGPSRAAAELEASKAYMKDFFSRYSLPTATFRSFQASEYEAAQAHVRGEYAAGREVVVKTSGLAAGKGVLMPNSLEEALAALKTMMEDKAFGSAGDTVVVEQRLDGEECSCLAFCDGKKAWMMPVAQDHKRVNDGDQGLNTGGMGAYAPAPCATAAVKAQLDCILQKTVESLAKDGTPYVGVLFGGFMLTRDGPMLLEYNCRFGDPETEVILPLLSTDLYEIALGCANGNLEARVPKITWREDSAATVVCAAKGYPESYPKGLPITGIDIANALPDVKVYHAGTAVIDGVVKSSGGRVLTVTGLSSSLPSAVEKAYAGVSKLAFEPASSLHFRRDIAHRALKPAGTSEKGHLSALGDLSLSELTAVSPLDGRYRRCTKNIAEYFSEFGLIRYRVFVEIEYFIALMAKLGKELPSGSQERLRAVAEGFTSENALEIKGTEKVTNHDVKAVEYFIKARFDELGLQEFKEYVHFALTSQDVNNTATPLLLKHSLERAYLPSVEDLIVKLQGLLPEWNVSMLAKTHGQPASPTNLAKEFQVFIERMQAQLKLLRQVPHSCKFGGATGNMNAHLVTYPSIDWRGFANDFCRENLGLQRQQYTTQIEHYDNMGAIFDAIKRINTILLDLCRDVWMYVSMGYFKQRIVAGEVGSSAMPHKVNPIDFENAEGNLGLANAMLEHLSQKLPVSRLQRDLTDSTVLRNVGVPMGYVAIALASLQKGLGKLMINKAAIDDDLENNWAVVAEAIQNILRRELYPKPYEALRDLTRTNEKMDRARIHAFVDGLNVSAEVKAELKAVTPFNYVGYT